MALHWFFQFAVVRVTPNMFVGLHVWGAFVFWAGVCVVGLVVLGVWAPETKGVALERMDELFRGRWYMGWKARVGPDEWQVALVQRRSPVGMRKMRRKGLRIGWSG
jgi:hypothetical protein